MVDLEEFGQGKHLADKDHVGHANPTPASNGTGAAGSTHVVVPIQGGGPESKLAEEKEGGRSRRGLYIGLGSCLLMLVVLAAVLGLTRCFGSC